MAKIPQKCSSCLKSGGVYHPHQGRSLCSKCSAYFALVDNLTVLMAERTLDLVAELLPLGRAHGLDVTTLKDIFTAFVETPDYKSGLDALIDPPHAEDSEVSDEN